MLTHPLTLDYLSSALALVGSVPGGKSLEESIVIDEVHLRGRDGGTTGECVEGGLTPLVSERRGGDTEGGSDHLGLFDEELALVRSLGRGEGEHAIVAEGKEGTRGGLTSATPEEMAITAGRDGHYGQGLSVDRQGGQAIVQQAAKGLIFTEASQGGHRSSPLQRTLSKPGLSSATKMKAAKARNNSTEKIPSAAGSASGAASATGSGSGAGSGDGPVEGSIVRHLFVDSGNVDGNDGNNCVPTGGGTGSKGREGDVDVSSADEKGVLVGMPEVLRLLQDADERIKRVASGLTPPRAVPPPESESWSLRGEVKVKGSLDEEGGASRATENDVVMKMMLSQRAGNSDLGEHMGEPNDWASHGVSGHEVGVGATVARVARVMAERVAAGLGLGVGVGLEGSGGGVGDTNDTDNYYKNYNNQVVSGSSHLSYTHSTPSHPHNHQPTLTTTSTSPTPTPPTSSGAMDHVVSEGRGGVHDRVSHVPPSPSPNPNPNSPKLHNINIPKPILQRISVGIITSQIKQV